MLVKEDPLHHDHDGPAGAGRGRTGKGQENQDQKQEQPPKAEPSRAPLPGPIRPCSLVTAGVQG